MAIPRVFISSTCYDLRYIRENLKFFIRNMGFEPVLSEEGNVFYDPKLHVQDACLAEVPICQIFVLIIGGRFGSKYKKSPKSITNREYIEAVKSGVPIFALVEQPVHSQFIVYRQNKENTNIDSTKINYPDVDSIKIFDFMEEVQNNSINNALVPFSDYHYLEFYLKQQWAGMMYNFLSQEGESKRVANTLATLTEMSDRIEFLSKQILASVGTDIDTLNVKIFEKMLEHSSIHGLADIGLKLSPLDLVKAKNFKDVLGDKIKITNEKGLRRSYARNSDGRLTDGTMTKDYYLQEEKDFNKLREKLKIILQDANITPEQFLKKSKKR